MSYGLVAVTLSATLGMNAFTIAQILRAITNVPWWDQWVMIQELASHEQGRPLLPMLWSSYWGHRLVVLRLLFLADARWGSLRSLSWLTMSAHFADIGLLVALAWLLLGRKSLASFTLTAAVILNLMLYPFQMENFAWSMQVAYVLIYATAGLSFLLLALSSGTEPSGHKHRRLLLTLCAIAALVSTYSVPNGLFVWPILVLQAKYLKVNRRTIVTLAVLGTATVASYLWHYQRPAMGMGAGGMLRDPFHALVLLGLFLGGPIDFISIHLGEVAGVLGLVVTGYIVTLALRPRSPEQKWVSALAAMTLFLLLTAVSVVFGRLGLESLHGQFPLPNRYFTPIGVFWASVAPLVLYTCWRLNRRPVLLGFYGVLFFGLTFATLPRQVVDGEYWADFFRGTDAVGSAMLLGVPDEELLWRLWPARADREEMVAFLRQRSLAMFSEPRALWPGKTVSELFRVASEHRCSGGIERSTAIEPNRAWRIEGWALDGQSGSALHDILFTDATGRIIGLARGGFRHRYFPGFLEEPKPPPAPASHAGTRRSEFLGYARIEGGAQMMIYAVLPRGREVCEIGPAALPI